MTIEKIIKYYHFVFDNTHIFEGHTHNTHEVNIVLKGNLEVTVNNNVFKLCAGDMLIWSPMMFHRDRVISNGDTEFLSIHFLADDATSPKDLIGFYRLGHSNLMLVNILIEEMAQNGGQISRAAESIFAALLLRSQKDDQKPEFSRHAAALIYREAVDLMTQNLSSMLCISEIAHSCGVCETTLKNAFKKYTGKSIKSYYHDFKMQKAREMLQGGKSAKEVAVNLGYSSLSYFSQCFKRENRQNIREYIARLKENK